MIERILKLHNIHPIFVKSFTPRTGLIGYAKILAEAFFETGETVDVAVFLTDQDKQKKRVGKTIQKLISKAKPYYTDVSAIGVPDPHFEAWLIADDGYVKSYFLLPSTESLPMPDLEPKERLEYLQRNMAIPKKPIFQVYEELASSINLDILMARRDFKTFVDQLLAACKYFTQI